MRQTFEDVACTVCGCVCDDLRVTVEDGRIVQAAGACHLAEPRLVGLTARRGPAAELQDKSAELSAAVEESVTLLAKAKAPLVLGLVQSSTESQRAACRLADYLGAALDVTGSSSHAASITALQRVGLSTCSLGEVRHRCDLVIYWGSNPVVSHPRHLERYTVDSEGRFVGGRSEKTLVVVDVHRTETAKRADLFLHIPAGSDFEVLWALRALVAGIELEASWQPPKGVSLDVLRDLAARMKSCRGGAIFFGEGLTRQGVGHATVDGLFRLVRELNAHTRFYARRMREFGDIAGADNVLTWQTGYPTSVNLAAGYPRYSPGEYSAGALLERGEVDACVLVGCEGLEHLPASARERLTHLPTIVLDHSDAKLDWQPAVRFRTAKYGIERPGTAYRMDEVPIPLRPVLTSELPSDDEVLSQILEGLKSAR